MRWHEQEVRYGPNSVTKFFSLFFFLFKLLAYIKKVKTDSVCLSLATQIYCLKRFILNIFGVQVPEECPSQCKKFVIFHKISMLESITK